MKLADVPAESDFLDVDGIPVVRLPDGSCVAFEPLRETEASPFPNASKAGLEGDMLSRGEFVKWLATGYNRFDLSEWRADLPQ